MHHLLVQPDLLRPLLDAFAREGSASAMEELVRRTRRRLLSVARRIGAPQDADDTVQAAYHALLRRPGAPESSVQGWLVATVVRIAYRKKALAQRAHDLAARLDAPCPETSPSVRVAQSETAQRLRHEVQRLPAKYRDAVVLFHLQGLSAEETARLLEVPRSTVTTRLSRARALLRSRLGPRFAHGLALVPWLLADRAGPLAAHLAKAMKVGGSMKAKAAIVLTGVGLVAGSVGVLVGAQAALAPRPESRTSAPERGSLTVAHVAAIQEIKRLRTQVTELSKKESRAPGGSGPAGGAPPPPAGAGSGATAVKSNPFAYLLRKRSFNRKKAEAAARASHVSAEELDVAVRAYNTVATGADPKQREKLLTMLRDLGERRTETIVAVLSGLEDGPAYADPAVRSLLKAGVVAGREQVILDALASDTTSRWAKKQILTNLDAVDSPAVRDYLVERLGGETDRYLSSDVAMTLGELKEPRAVSHCNRLLRAGGDWAPFAPYFLIALGKIGGDEAQGALLDHARRVPSQAAAALRALAKLDPTTARLEAENLLRSEDARKLSPANRKTVEKVAREG